MRTIFASLARANLRVHMHNGGNFPQAKPSSEINTRFLLNEFCKIYFFLLHNSLHIILFNRKKFLKKLSEGKKK